MQAQQSTETQSLATQMKTVSHHVESSDKQVESAIESKLSARLAELDALLSKRLRGASYQDKE